MRIAAATMEPPGEPKLSDKPQGDLLRLLDALRWSVREQNLRVSQ